jgi:hypothetical protein
MTDKINNLKKETIGSGFFIMVHAFEAFQSYRVSIYQSEE